MVSIAELVDYPDKAPASVGAIVTNLRLRTTKKGEKMAWLTLADGTGAIECAVFPNAYERLAETSQAQSSLREAPSWSPVDAWHNRKQPDQSCSLTRCRSSEGLSRS